MRGTLRCIHEPCVHDASCMRVFLCAPVFAAARYAELGRTVADVIAEADAQSDAATAASQLFFSGWWTHDVLHNKQ